MTQVEETIAPPGPDSVTWQFFGGWRGMLMGLWSGSMQNMHPKLAAGVWDHSDFFGERWERLMRSLYPISGVVFDRTPETGREVRDYHLTIKGTMDNGERYHALDPDVFYWAHATFFKSTLLAAEWLGGGLTEGADLGSAMILRSGEPVMHVDLRGLLEEGDLTQNEVLLAGDVIVVREAGKISVLGEVNAPQSFQVTEPVSVVEALALAGSTTPDADLRRALVVKTGIL